MKDKNTLARVILWAVIVVILCGAFVGVLLRYRFEQANTEPAAPLILHWKTAAQARCLRRKASTMLQITSPPRRIPLSAPWMRSFPLLPRPLRSPYRISARSR